MSKPTHERSQWTLDTLKEHFEQQINCLEKRVVAGFNAQEQKVAAAMAAADKAVLKAETANEKRFDAVSEFRNEQSAREHDLMPRSEVMVLMQSKAEKITRLSQQIDKMQAERRGVAGGWGYAVGVVGFVISILSIISLVIQAMK